MPIKISASTNPPKQEDLLDYISKLDQTEVDYIHCDVMDGQFVEARTFSAKTLKKIKKETSKKLDVHLMIKKPDRKVKRYVRAGADILTVHFEAFKDKNKLVKCLQSIRKTGCFVGMSFSPHTSVLEVLPYIVYCDLLLVMSVVPGKSGQEFMPETLVKLDLINKFLAKQKLEIVIEVDGGINEDNLPKLLEKKVEVVVVGNFLFKSKNLQKTIKKLKML